MRRASSVLVVSALMITGFVIWHPSRNTASAQPNDGTLRLAQAKKGQAKKQAAPPIKDSAQKKAGPKEASANTGGIPIAERTGIQFDLAWTGHYNGLINGEFN